MLSQNETVRQLHLLRARIADPKNWTTHALARDAHGKSVMPWDDRAMQFCLAGAAMAVSKGCSRLSEERLWRALVKQSGGDDHQPIRINNLQGHAAVLALIDSAIAAEIDEAADA